MQGADNAHPITRGYTTCRFGQLHYRSAGTPRADRPALVLLHQNPSSSFEYEPLLAALADRCHVIAFDTPGYGMSDKPPVPQPIAAYAAAFADGIAALQHDGTLGAQVDVYGFHSGTLHAIELALALPRMVRRLCLTGIPMYPPEKRAELLAKAQGFARPDESGEVVLGQLRMLWDYVVTGRDRRVPLDKAMLAFSDKTFALERMQWVYMGVWAYDYARLPDVRQPVLMLQPHEDLLAASLAAAELLTNATVREMPDLDRDIFDVAPERIADELHDFLA